MNEQQRRLAEELLFTNEKRPSFAQGLYFGKLDISHVFPYPQVDSEEQQRVDQFVHTVDAFAKANIDGDWIDRHAQIPDHVISGLGKIGLLGCTIPKEYGGLNLSQYGYCRAMESLAHYCGSTALFINAHQSIGLKALLLFGTESQRKQWLPSLADGTIHAAFSLTEPNAGSDASAIETRATFDATKNVYRISGKKQWTTNGSLAGMLTVMAKTEVITPQGKKDKITAFIVTPNMPGFTILNPGLEKVGMRGTKTSNLQFDNVEVPADNILGPLGGGLKVCLTVLDYGRTTFGATCTGTAKFVLEQAINHACHRFQFDQPLASFPLVKKKLAHMAGLVYAMEATTYLTAGLVDSKTSEFMLEAAMLKVFNSDALWTITYETMQIYGGRSFFTDCPLERIMRDARLNMIGEGSNEVLRAFIGVVGMRDVGMQLKSFLEALRHPFDQFPHLKKCGTQLLNQMSAPHVPIKSNILKQEGQRLSSLIRTFGCAVIRLLATYGENILEKQLALDRIATSAMALYTTTAVLSRLDSDLHRVNHVIKDLGNDVCIAKFYCKQALDLADRSLSRLFKHNDDEMIEQVSDQITGLGLKK